MRGQIMRRFVRKLLVGIYVFLLCLGIPKQGIQTQALEEEVTVYDFVANEATGEFLQQFAQIGQFNEYGIAIVSVENGVDYDNNPSYLYGLINLDGVLVLPVEYSSITSFNNSFYYVMKYNQVHNPFNVGLVSKVDGSIVLEPKYVMFDFFKSNSLFMVEYSPTNSFMNRIQETYQYKDSQLIKLDYSDLSEGYTSISLGDKIANKYYIVEATVGSLYEGTYQSKQFLVDLDGNPLQGNDLLVRIETSFVVDGLVYILSRDSNDQSKYSLLKIDENNVIQELIHEKWSIYYRRFEERLIYDDGWMDLETFTHHDEVILDNDGPFTITQVDGLYQLQDDEGASLLPSEYEVTSIAYEGALNWYRFSVDKQIINSSNSEESEILSLEGFYSVDERRIVLSPDYQYLYSEVGRLVNKGNLVVRKLTGTYYIQPYYNQKMYDVKYGLLSIDGSMLIEPQYDYLYAPNTDGLVEFGLQSTLENGYRMITARGVFDVQQMKVLAPGDYDMYQPYYETMNYAVMPLFDENGHIRIVDSSNDYSREHNVELQGILSREGIIYPVDYLKAYFRNGLYHLNLKDGKWLLESKDKSFSIVLDLDQLDLGIEGKIESVDRRDGFYVLEVSYQDTIGTQTRYGVLNDDLSIHLPFEFTNISIEGNLLNLERYNEISLRTEVAVYDIDTQNYVVPFGNKYESMSDYVGGVAIGQSGTAEAPVTTFLFGLNVNASEDDFVLDIINDEGYVVGDLSEKYSETLLLGKNDEGKTQAMVKRNGQYYLASLQTSQVPLKAIESVTLLQSSLTLKVGDLTQLNGIIKPLDSNEPVKILWESSDASVVAVNGTGQIKALKDGSATVVFKVNEHVASVSIKVGETIVPPVTPPSPPVPPMNPNQGPIVMPPAPNPPVLNIIQPLFALLNHKNVRFAQFEATLKKTYENNPDFLDNLSESELDRFEEMVYEFYKDKLNIEIEQGFEIEDVFKLIDYGLLTDNKSFSLGFHVSEDIDESDKSLVNEFMMSNQLSGDDVLFLDIEFLINDVLQTELSSPITIRMNIPDALKDVKDLKVLRVHNGVVSTLDVTYLENGQISFETDRFSLYALIKSMPVSTNVIVPEIPITNESKFPWFLATSGFLVVVAGGVLLVRRKQTQN